MATTDFSWLMKPKTLTWGVVLWWVSEGLTLDLVLEIIINQWRMNKDKTFTRRLKLEAGINYVQSRDTRGRGTQNNTSLNSEKVYKNYLFLFRNISWFAKKNFLQILRDLELLIFFLLFQKLKLTSQFCQTIIFNILLRKTL